MTLSLDESKSLILRSASLRGEGRVSEAIDALEPRLAEMHPDYLLNAHLEIIYAAREAGDRKKAVEHAIKLQAIDPDIPIVREILKA